VEVFAVLARQKLPLSGKFCRPAVHSAIPRQNAFSAAAQNRCLSESESGAARRLPIGLPGKTPDERLRSIPERRDQ
jgi:hypothetical protein